MVTKLFFLTNYSYSTKVVGESNYQENLRSVIGFIDDEQQQVSEDGFTANLILEDENPYDRGNAVRVEINGYIVGYLSKSDASDYRQSLSRLKVNNAVGNCSAIVSGKWNNEVESLLFGVILDLDPKHLTVGRKVEEKAPLPVVAATKPTVQKDLSQPSGKTKPKIPLIPVKGNGCVYFLFVFPFVAIINLYILLFAGLWYGCQWIWKTATATPTRRRVSAALASVFTVCGVIFSAIPDVSESSSSSVPTLDLVSVQGTALAEAWSVYTQTAQASITDTPLPTATLQPTATQLPTFTLSPLPTATLITFSTATPFFMNLPANQPTVAPAGGSCSCSGDTLNCSDFGSWSSAQSCYNYCISQGVGDIHGLDRNNDGSACDSLK